MAKLPDPAQPCEFRWWSSHDRDIEFAHQKPGFRRGERCDRPSYFVVVAAGAAQSACRHHAHMVSQELTRRGVSHVVWFRFKRASVIANPGVDCRWYRPRLFDLLKLARGLSSVQSRPSD